MTSFECIFKKLKDVLNDPYLYDIWPDFSPEYDEEEFLQAKIGDLPVIMLHCASCEGPSDPRHPTCKKCVNSRVKKAEESLYPEKRWVAVALFRMYPLETLRD